MMGVACADLHAPPPLAAAGAANVDGAGNTNGGQTSSAAGAASSVGAFGGVSGAGVTQGSSSGAAAMGGDQGSGGGSGSAGEGGGQSCGSIATGEVHAWLHPELAALKSNELHPFLALTTTGPDIALQRLAIRYYFRAEMQGDWELDCIWVTKQVAAAGPLCENGTSLKIEALEPPHLEADHYLEISFPGVSSAEVLSQGQTPAFEARSMFWRAGHPTLDQANDYSFVPTTGNVMTVENRDYKETTKVTVYLDGKLIWGTEPCP